MGLVLTEGQRLARNTYERERRKANRARTLELKRIQYRKDRGKPEFKIKSQSLHKKNYDKNLNFINKYKLMCGCEKCGFNKCSRALSFHHKNPETKLFEIASSYTRSLLSIVLEMGKCELLCQNCHSILHYKHDWERKYRKTYIKNRKLAESIKECYRCKICNNSDYRVLQFHHTNPIDKMGEVSTLYKKSEEIILAEINKCVVLCANCHMYFHNLGD